MKKKPFVDHKDIVSFLEVLSNYCVFYFGEREGLELYNYYCNNYVYIIPAMKNGKYVHGEKFSRLQLIFIKIKADVFFNRIEVYYVTWPYNKGEIKQIDFGLFELTCFDFYEAFGEFEMSKGEKARLGFSSKLLNLLLPPQKGLLFNHDEWRNKDTVLMEGLYTELKKRNLDIIREYGKSFREFGKDEFLNYIEQKIRKTPQQLSLALWLIVRER